MNLQNMQTVTAIIPVFNRRHTLQRAIDSVLNQSRAVDEIIVVDDGSTDGTVEWLRQIYPQVKLIELVNKGVSAARNVGIKAAKGEWIALLDSDDEWLPEKIQTQFEQLDSISDSVRLCHTDEIWIRDGIRVNPMRKHQKTGGWIFERCLPMCVISPSSCLLHRRLFEDVGLFNEALPACEDYDLWLRVCAQEPVLFVDQPLLVKYGGHEDQLSRKYWGMDRFRVKALHALLLQGVLSDEQSVLVRQQMVSKLEVLIKGAKKREKTTDLIAYQTLLVDVQSDMGKINA